MGKSKATAIGKITSLRRINAEGLLFHGEGTRLVSNFVYDEYSDQYYNKIYEIKYQVKSGAKYIDLFLIRHSIKESIYNRMYYTRLLNKVTSKGNSIGSREEKILSKLSKEKIAKNKNYEKEAYTYYAVNPIQFCTIPFLEDDVKNWILTAGQFTYSEKDFKELAKSLTS